MPCQPAEQPVAHAAAPVPVAYPALQDTIEQRTPFVCIAVAVFLHQSQHGILYQLQCLIAVSRGDFGHAQGAPFDARQEAIQFRCSVQRLFLVDYPLPSLCAA